MASDIWLRTILIERKETCCRHIGYSYRLTARVLLYAPSHRQDNTYHGLCYTSRGALAGTRNSSMESHKVIWAYWLACGNNSASELKFYTYLHLTEFVKGFFYVPVQCTDRIILQVRWRGDCSHRLPLLVLRGGWWGPLVHRSL